MYKKCAKNVPNCVAAISSNLGHNLGRLSNDCPNKSMLEVAFDHVACPELSISNLEVLKK